jgi:hypothetical protein
MMLGESNFVAAIEVHLAPTPTLGGAWVLSFDAGQAGSC